MMSPSSDASPNGTPFGHVSPRLLDNLNPEQLKAVTLPRESALVLAGAGSGKTRVLTTRIAYLIQSGQATPGAILGVTFTNKAAKEMLTRLSAMMPINTRGMWVGTFHGLCNRLLRAHYRDANLPQTFQILDSSDQQSALKRLMKTLNIDDEKYKPRDMAWFINSAKEQGLRSNHVEARDEFTRRQVEIYQAYDEQCQREGVVDFAELLLRCFELLSKNAQLLEHYRSRFKFILVDEFQDTNRLQYQWIQLIAGAIERSAVFAVGDDDQSIYAFRGAEVANMRDFQRDFARGNVIKLEQNYRSQGNILDAANAVISHNKDRLGKNLWTDEGKGEPLRIYAASTDADEAQFVVDEVKSLHREGKNLSEMALLYRSNAQSRVLEHALFRAGIAYRVYGGMRFFERQEVKHALAYLRLAANPNDDGAFSRVVNFPPRGIGARSIEQIQELALRYNQSLYEAALNGIAQNTISGRSAAAIGTFLRVVEGLKSTSEAKVSLAELVDEAMQKSGLKSHYQTEREGQDRLENLAELVTACAQFEETYEGDDSALVGFLTHASLEAGEHEAAATDDALQLMTVHAAKGLEFDHVFLGGLEEGLFPHENSLQDFAGIEEERRLMYVAITRARKRLYLSYAAQRMLHGQTRYGIVSRFVDEIPAALCKWLVVPEKQAAYQFPSSSGNGEGWGLRSGVRGSYSSENRSQSSYTGFRQTSNSYGYKDEKAPEYGREGAPDTARAPFETKQSGGHPFAIGQNVSHAKFGEGVVLTFEGRGNDARVQVKFRSEGTKWLALQYAKLTAV
jgi:DNA helicase II / ATP-dependent DNA helicase PcrA